MKKSPKQLKTENKYWCALLAYILIFLKNKKAINPLRKNDDKFIFELMERTTKIESIVRQSLYL